MKYSITNILNANKNSLAVGKLNENKPSSERWLISSNISSQIIDDIVIFMLIFSYLNISMLHFRFRTAFHGLFISFDMEMKNMRVTVSINDIENFSGVKINKSTDN